MISTIAWVPAGVADPSPKRYEMNATELELLRMMQEEKEDITEEVESTTIFNKTPEEPSIKSDLPADLRMDEYSSGEEDNRDITVGNMLVGVKEETIGTISEKMVPQEVKEAEAEADEKENAETDGLKPTDAMMDDIDDISNGDSDDCDDLADVPDTREYIPNDVEGLQAIGLSQIGGAKDAVYMNDLGGDGDDDSEAEDVRLTDDDACVVIAKTEDDFASLEVHVYDQRRGNLYVHHDIPLPAYPLCLAHGRVSSTGTTGNYCAVGTFSPGIEIWNLDVLNALEPSCVLGGEDTTYADEQMKAQMMRQAGGGTDQQKLQLGGGKSIHSAGGLRPGSHTDAVMALSWNFTHQQVIASGSADCTVKLWDVTRAGNTDEVDTNEKCCSATLAHHRDKVQSVAWHPQEGTLLATGSYDKTVALLDARNSSRENVKSVKITDDCETIEWDPFHPEYLTVASEDGTVTCWDVRQFETSKPLWSFVANEFGVGDMSYNSCVPGLLTTCSDKTVTLWDTYQNGAPTANFPPRSCGSRDMAAGKLYAVSFYPSAPWVLGCGGSGNILSLWDLSSEEAVQKRFQSRLNMDKQTDCTEAKQEDLEAMMANDKVDETAPRKTRSKKKNKAKGKRKVHRR